MGRCFNILIGFLAGMSLAASAIAGSGNENGYIYSGFVVPEYSLSVDTKPPQDDPTAETSTLTFMAPTNVALSFGVNYEGITLGTSFDMPSGEKTDSTGAVEAKMESSYTSYGLSYFGERLGMSAAYTDLTGMELQSVSNVDSAHIIGDPDTKRQDIRLKSHSANIWFMPFAYNLSLDSYFDPAEKSRGSGIGLVIVGSYNEGLLSTSKPLVADQYAAPYGADATLTQGHFISTSAGFGPAFSLDVFGLYFSGLLTMGSGNQKLEYTIAEQTISRGGTGQKGDLYVAAGYKGSTYFTTVNLMMNQPAYKLETITVRTAEGYVAWTFGRRY